jgi:hypothetical protein
MQFLPTDAALMTHLGRLAITVFQPIVLQPLPTPDQVLCCPADAC